MANPNPHFERHESFVTNTKLQYCVIINEHSNAQKCQFISNTMDCHANDQFIDYTNFLFCMAHTDHRIEFYLRIVLMVIFCISLFVILGITADKFFCPALTIISQKLGLSDSLAGATVLAFGNGSPDLFTALANYDGDTEMLYAQLFGGALFVIGFVAALILIVMPFTLDRQTIIRDMVFYLITCIWLAVSFRDEYFTYLEANGAILIYVIYLTILIIEHFTKTDDMSDILPIPQADADFQLSIISESLFQHLVSSLNPFDTEESIVSGKFDRTFQILKAPIVIILNLLVPVVDSNLDNNGWNKLLNSLQIVMLPMAVILLKQSTSVTFLNVSITWIMLIITIPLSIIVLSTSKANRAPAYHMAFAVFGSFIGSVCVISTCATEVVAILSALGTVGNVSDSLLGLSVLSWGNGIGDLISNVSLARSGFPKMGFAACFGGPMFNGLLGIGIIFNLKLFHSVDGIAFTRAGDIGPTCAFFLFALIVFSLIAFIFTNYQGRRSIGALMIAIYCVYLLFCLLSELEIIHPYGTDHQNEINN